MTMNKLFTSFAAAALSIGLLATAASAASLPPSQQDAAAPGVVIVPASATPHQDEAAAPAFRRAKIVDFDTSARAGSIIISTKQNRLYYVLGNGKAAMYRVATAKRGFEWKGTHQVSAKAKWPNWSPPKEMRARHPELPSFMAGGPENPLGARAMYLGSSIYRIHGTNAPSSIGKAASSGCIRMLNEDVTELYKFVKLGARVTVL
jgi:lipoprotein-anchoring transpeptidase ErfK/SrfK